MSLPPPNPRLIAFTIHSLGGKAGLQAIYQRFASEHPEIEAQYKDRGSFEATIRSAIQNHCPQSEGFKEGSEAIFERVGRGRYRIVPLRERPGVIEAGRKVDR